MKARTWDELREATRKLDIVQRTEFLKHLAVNLGLIDDEEDGDVMREAWQTALETTRGELILMSWPEILNSVNGMGWPRRIIMLDYILGEFEGKGTLPGLTPEERHHDNRIREIIENGVTEAETGTDAA